MLPWTILCVLSSFIYISYILSCLCFFLICSFLTPIKLEVRYWAGSHCFLSAVVLSTVSRKWALNMCSFNCISWRNPSKWLLFVYVQLPLVSGALSILMMKPQTPLRLACLPRSQKETFRSGGLLFPWKQNTQHYSGLWHRCCDTPFTSTPGIFIASSCRFGFPLNQLWVWMEVRIC